MNEALEAKAILTDGTVIYPKDIIAKAVVTNVVTEMNQYQVNYGLQSAAQPSRATTTLTLQVINSYNDDLRGLENKLHFEVLLIRRDT